MSDFESVGSCLDDDLLVTLSVALGAGAAPALAHVSACATCLARLHDIEHLREALASEEPLRAGFADQVVEALQAVGAASDSEPLVAPGQAPLRGVTVLNPILAAAAALFLILPGGAGSVDPGAAVIVSALFGVAVLVWNSFRWSPAPSS